MQRRALAQAGRDLAAVQAEHVAREIEDRDHYRTVEVLVAALAQDAELLQPPAHLGAGLAVLLRQPVAERAVGEAQLAVRNHLGMREAAAFEIAQRFGRSLQHLVVVVDHLAQDLLIAGVRRDGRFEARGGVFADDAAAA